MGADKLFVTVELAPGVDAADLLDALEVDDKALRQGVADSRPAGRSAAIETKQVDERDCAYEGSRDEDRESEMVGERGETGSQPIHAL